MRLTVILIQPPPPEGVSLAEELVGELIGRPGLDLTLVGRLESLEKSSTDQLTLDSISGPAAVLDWQPASELFESLSKINFLGLPTPHQLAPETPAATGGSNRQIFLFDLNQLRDARAILGELQRLRESLGVKTFSLGSLQPAKQETAVSPSEKPLDSVHAEQRSEPEPIARAAAIRSDEDALDDLIDRLDELDV